MKENERPRVPMEKKSENIEPIPPLNIKWASTKKPDAPKAGEMVEQAFTAAVVATVENNEKVQSEIVEGAEKVIQNKTHAIKAQAEMEAKEAYFNNKKGACECFGYNETTTERWAVNFMAAWHNVATAIWIIIGMFTFAPITFISKKIKVIVKHAWVAVVIAIIIYLLVVLSPWWVQFLANINGGLQWKQM